MTFQVDAAKIQENTPLYSPIQYFTQPFKPYIDDFNMDPFIPKDPLDMIEAGEFNDVPLILGNNKDEGLMNALTFYHKPELLEEVTRKWNEDQGPFFVGARFVLLMIDLSSSLLYSQHASKFLLIFYFCFLLTLLPLNPVSLIAIFALWQCKHSFIPK